jgi:hypothetical protein
MKQLGGPAYNKRDQLESFPPKLRVRELPEPATKLTTFPLPNGSGRGYPKNKKS